MGGNPRSPALLDVLSGSRPGTDTVVATRLGTVVGHAMAGYVTGPGAGLAADIGVVVADAWQGRGVGSALMRAVAGRAHGRGAALMTMDVLAENRQVLSMIAGHWPGAPHTCSGPYVAIRAPIPPPAVSGPGAQPGGWDGAGGWDLPGGWDLAGGRDLPGGWDLAGGRDLPGGWDLAGGRDGAGVGAAGRAPSPRR